ncbi:MAG: hypothetical protein AB4368_27990 [Xenococcaceae cyanobacterium]
MSSTKDSPVSYEPQPWRTKNVTASTAPTIETYKVSRGEDGLIVWEAPDGMRYFLDPANAPIDKYSFVRDGNGKKVMAYKPSSTGDGELVVSLEGAVSIACTLLHDEDDVPRKYYFATDARNNNPLERPAFILRAEGLSNSPVQRFALLRVMCLQLT